MRKREGAVQSLQAAMRLLSEIPVGKQTTSTELFSRLKRTDYGRDQRTVQRHLKMLCAAGYVKCDNRGKPYGYQLSPAGKRFAPVVANLTEQQSLFLILAEQNLRNLLPPDLMRSMQGFLEQARTNLMPHTSARKARDWLKKVRFVSETQPLLPPEIKAGVLQETSSALFHDNWLDIDYKNAADKQTKATVMPLGLAQKGARLYLVCRFEGYDDTRILAVNRIQHARRTELNFERPKGFDLQRYDAEGRFGFGRGRKIRLKFSIDLSSGHHLLESKLSADQRVRKLDDRYEITATVVDSEVLKKWLRGFGKEIKVLRPLRYLERV